MTNDEAIEICEQWFRYNETQEAKSLELQRLAALARTGPEGHAEALRRRRQIDNTPRVFDGANLEPAVRHLVALARSGEKG